MKLLLLKVLLQRRAKDAGFTLPVVIALGLIMTLLGLVNIISANEENLTATTTNSRNDSLAIAEIGIARYRELLDRNRILALYNVYTDKDGNRVDRWTGTDATSNAFGSENVFGVNDVCSNDLATFSNRNTWHDVILKEADAGVDFNRDGDTSDEPNMGQYRLVSYVYDIDGDLETEDVRTIAVDGTNTLFSNFSQTYDEADDERDSDLTDNVAFNDTDYNPRGVLTVQGRTPEGGALSQIEVEIPIRLNQEDMDNLAPALWIGDGNISNLGNLLIADGSDADTFSDTNIVVSAPTTSGVAGCGNADPDDTDQNVIVSDPRSIPPIQFVKNTIETAKSDNGNQVNSTLTPILGRPASLGDKPYVPSADGNSFVDYASRDSVTGDWDCEDIEDCRYYYEPPAPVTIGVDTQTDGVAKVTLYVDGDLNINADIGSSISSNYLEIYVEGNITIDATGRDIEIDALIHAPNSKLSITGGGDVEINGSVWVNEFENNTTGNVTIAPDNTDMSSSITDRSYKFYTSTLDRVARPITGSPTNWQTEEKED